MLSTIVTGLAGASLAAIILWDAFESVLVPRRIGRRVRLTRYFYVASWHVWRGLARPVRKASRREMMLGLFAPLSQIVLLGVWALGLITAFALMQSAAAALGGVAPLTPATQLYLSGETFFTLGFGDITPTTGLGRLLSVLESGVGFGFLGTVVGYLPTLYSSFSQREIEISLLDARAGSPPTAAAFLHRHAGANGRALEVAALRDWERWSAQLLETHISYPQLAYYRSQHVNQSWLAALTAILDASSVMIAAEDAAVEQAELTFAMARHAMVDISHIFVHAYQPPAIDRLPAAERSRLREYLAHRITGVSEQDFGERLNSLRSLYEPYAQALAAHLEYELPPWMHAERRRDNWRGGPWDKQIAPAPVMEALWEEHF